MNTRNVVAVVAVALLVMVGGVAAFAFGIGPFGSGGDEQNLDDFPTGTPMESEGSGGGGGSGGSNSGGSDSSVSQSLPAYSFRVTNIEKCGRTCRDVTVELQNNRNETAKGITAYVRIFAGNSTDSSARVWQTKVEIGRLTAGGSTTVTKRVTLSLVEGFKVQQKGGWITIVTTVQSDKVTLTFKERRNVT